METDGRKTIKVTAIVVLGIIGVISIIYIISLILNGGLSCENNKTGTSDGNNKPSAVPFSLKRVDTDHYQIFEELFEDLLKTTPDSIINAPTHDIKHAVDNHKETVIKLITAINFNIIFLGGGDLSNALVGNVNNLYDYNIFDDQDAENAKEWIEIILHNPTIHTQIALNATSIANIKYLTFQGCKMVEIPNTVFKIFKGATCANFASTGITGGLENLADMPYLESILAMNNNLTHVPNLSAFKKLKRVDLTLNNITSIDIDKRTNKNNAAIIILRMKGSAKFSKKICKIADDHNNIKLLK